MLPRWQPPVNRNVAPAATRHSGGIHLTTGLPVWQHAAMTLQEYLRQHGITYRAFGETLGRDGAEVWRWAHGHRTPSLEMAARIENVTDEAVPAASFLSGAALLGRQGNSDDSVGRANHASVNEGVQ